MTKKTRDDAIYISGLPSELEMEQIEETFGTAGIIKVKLYAAGTFSSYLVH